MDSQDKEIKSVQLASLGAVELATFLAIGAWIYFDSTGGWGEVVPMAIPVEMVVAYFMGALTLVPSTVMFIQAAKGTTVRKLRVARGLQLALFICVCIAVLPSMFFASWHPQFLIACLVGFVFYLIATSTVKSLTPGYQPKSFATAPTDQVEPAKTSPAGQFCAKCGSLLDSTGKCSECA